MTRDEMTLALFSDAWLGRAFENNPGVLECKFLSRGEILEYQNLKGTYSPRLALPWTHKDPEAQGPEVGSPRQHCPAPLWSPRDGGGVSCMLMEGARPYPSPRAVVPCSQAASSRSASALRHGELAVPATAYIFKHVLCPGRSSRPRWCHFRAKGPVEIPLATRPVESREQCSQACRPDELTDSFILCLP